MIYYLESF